MGGLFVTLEGPDGSGKSTIIRLLGEYLQDKNLDFITTREPGGTPIGEKIRELILDVDNIDMGNETEALLYAASRGQHIHEKIIPALEGNKIVLCDRFVLSSLAYQGVGRELGIKNVKEINDFALKGVYPDLILFFHVDPEVTLNRKIKEFEGDRLEKEGNIFHNRVYDGYMEILKEYPKNVKIIDATQTIEKVFQQSIKEIEKKLDSKEA
ncbi:MAG TPA: dTMP kinase [Tissierellaceae bacterium]|nr:dTMP kinase [Tissierellaceae bacterium]